MWECADALVFLFTQGGFALVMREVLFFLQY